MSMLWFSFYLQGTYSPDWRFSIFLTHNFFLYHCPEPFRVQYCQMLNIMLHRSTYLNIDLLFNTCEVHSSCKHLFTYLSMKWISQVDRGSWAQSQSWALCFPLASRGAAQHGTVSTRHRALQSWIWNTTFFVTPVCGDSVPSSADI